jgi:hypothetical protein
VKAANTGRLPCIVTPLGRLFDAADVQAFKDKREARLASK